ncbi:MAG: shikimate dehydrogenase [Gemmatimonadales bacterium]
MTRPSRLVLIGHPVAHSFSPGMQGAALSAAGISVKYSVADVAPGELRATLDALSNEHAAGNITIPHKEAARALMTRVTPLADRIGAANTFYTADDGALVGDNTDVAGFADLVTSVLGTVPASARFAVIGAGGAAAAVLAAIETWTGCSAVIYARNKTRAQNLSQRFSGVASVKAMMDAPQLDGDIVVNATPVGLNDDGLPVELSRVAPGAAVLDLICRAGETAWVRLARARGHVAGDGAAMLVGQGAAAFEIWFGVPPDREAMWRGLTLQMQST